MTDLQKILDAADHGICEISAQGVCTFVNIAAAKLLGYEPADLAGKSFHTTVHHHRADGRVYPEGDCPIQRALRGGYADRVAEDVFWHKQGHAILVTYAVAPVEDGAAQPAAVLTFTDCTEPSRMASELRRMAAALSEADRRRTEFVATLAHELRNPLAPVRNGLELIRKAGNDPAAVAQVRDMMARQIGQLVRLINDLLDIARVSSGRMKIVREAVTLQSLVEAATETNAELLKQSQLELRLRMPAEPILMMADATRLIQVFNNLLDNAAKYTPAGGLITVTVTQDEAEARVEFVDSGVGIAAHSLGAVFDMFARVGLSAMGTQEGLGIGLNLVRRLVELHGGSVSAQSEGVNRGSVFVVTLPLTPLDAHSNPVIRTPLAPDVEGSVKVLVVDDNVDAAETLSSLLASDHRITRVANDGREALRAVGEFRPDIVFLDIGMPGIDGYQVARAIREMPGIGQPVLVALTGWGTADDRERSRTAGFDRHLTKPADFSVIDQLLSSLGGTRDG